MLDSPFRSLETHFPRALSPPLELKLDSVEPCSSRKATDPVRRLEEAFREHVSSIKRAKRLQKASKSHRSGSKRAPKEPQAFVTVAGRAMRRANAGPWSLRLAPKLNQKV